MEQQNDGDSRGRPLRHRTHCRHHVRPPPHHVVQPSGSTSQSILENIPLLPSILPTSPEVLYPTERTSVFRDAGPRADVSSSIIKEESLDYIRTGFQNPWDSWHKPTLLEVWNGLSWSDSENGGHTSFKAYQSAIEEAQRKETGQASDSETLTSPPESPHVRTPSTENDAKELSPMDLHLRAPEFHNPHGIKSTWLGHASLLLQFPPLHETGEPIRVLFDPIFSLRCSPTQYIGPLRMYGPPCSLVDLPPIDIVLISHSHYDHLDYSTIVELWRLHSDRLQFVVPLGNKSWFLDLGIGVEEDRVTELDWWDEVWLDQQSSTDKDIDQTQRLRVVCTPAQHGSGRYGFDASRTLWSSWALEYSSPHSEEFRVFFGGDTGFQFHSSMSTPTSTPKKNNGELNEYPICPAFDEIRALLGPFQLSFLPISVGASFNYVKSYDSFGLVPSLDSGLTGANHMTPDDAVRVSKILGKGLPNSLAVAIHWGTFVSGIDEVRKSMKDVEISCIRQEVSFLREPKDRTLHQIPSPDEAHTFACLDHGQSLVTDI